MQMSVGVWSKQWIVLRRQFKIISKEMKKRQVLAIIDRRQKCQLHHPLHAAGHFLKFYSIVEVARIYDTKINNLSKQVDMVYT